MRCSLLLVLILVLLPAVALAAQGDVGAASDAAAASAIQGDAECPDTGLRQTLALLPQVVNTRTMRFYACTIHARDLAAKDVTLADLPPFAGQELLARLTDGDLANGEAYSIGVTPPDLTGAQLVRLVVAVPPCARYAGMEPVGLDRLGIHAYYAEIPVARDMAEAICRAGAEWCDDCN